MKTMNKVDMLLTKEQIDIARSDGVATLLTQAQPRSAKIVIELAAAYLRVVALLDAWHEANRTGRDMGERGPLEHVEAELRLALEG
jgi:hypothetical protein